MLRPSPSSCASVLARLPLALTLLAGCSRPNPPVAPTAAAPGTAAGAAIPGAPSGPAAAAPTWPADARLTVESVGPRRHRLSWTPASHPDGVGGYRILRGGTTVAVVPGDVTTRELEVRGTTLLFKIEAGTRQGVWSQDGPQATGTPDRAEARVGVAPPAGALARAAAARGPALRGEPGTVDHGLGDGLGRAAFRARGGHQGYAIESVRVEGACTEAEVRAWLDQRVSVLSLCLPRNGAWPDASRAHLTWALGSSAPEPKVRIEPRLPGEADAVVVRCLENRLRRYPVPPELAKEACTLEAVFKGNVPVPRGFLPPRVLRPPQGGGSTGGAAAPEGEVQRSAQ